MQNHLGEASKAPGDDYDEWPTVEEALEGARAEALEFIATLEDVFKTPEDEARSLYARTAQGAGAGYPD